MLLSKSENGWELHTIANGKLSCDNFYLNDSAEIDKVEERIKDKFGARVLKEG